MRTIYGTLLFLFLTFSVAAQEYLQYSPQKMEELVIHFEKHHPDKYNFLNSMIDIRQAMLGTPLPEFELQHSLRKELVFGFLSEAMENDQKKEAPVLESSVLTIFPNPTKHWLNLQLKGNIPIESIVIREIATNQIKAEIFLEKELGKKRIDVSFLKPGIYTISVKTPNNFYSTKFIRN